MRIVAVLITLATRNPWVSIIFSFLSLVMLQQQIRIYYLTRTVSHLEQVTVHYNLAFDQKIREYDQKLNNLTTAMLVRRSDVPHYLYTGALNPSTNQPPHEYATASALSLLWAPHHHELSEQERTIMMDLLSKQPQLAFEQIYRSASDSSGVSCTPFTLAFLQDNQTIWDLLYKHHPDAPRHTMLCCAMTGGCKSIPGFSNPGASVSVRMARASFCSSDLSQARRILDNPRFRLEPNDFECPSGLGTLQAATRAVMMAHPSFSTMA